MALIKAIEAINKKYEDAVASDAAANRNRAVGGKRGMAPAYTLDMVYEDASAVLKEYGYNNVDDLRGEQGNFLNLGGAVNGIYRNDDYDYRAGSILDENNTVGPVGGYGLLKVPDHESIVSPELVASVALMVVMPYAAPALASSLTAATGITVSNAVATGLITAASTAVQGGSPEDILKSAALSFVTTSMGETGTVANKIATDVQGTVMGMVPEAIRNSASILDTIPPDIMGFVKDTVKSTIINGGDVKAAVLSTLISKGVELTHGAIDDVIAGTRDQLALENPESAQFGYSSEENQAFFEEMDTDAANFQADLDNANDTFSNIDNGSSFNEIDADIANVNDTFSGIDNGPSFDEIDAPDPEWYKGGDTIAQPRTDALREQAIAAGWTGGEYGSFTDTNGDQWVINPAGQVARDPLLVNDNFNAQSANGVDVYPIAGQFSDEDWDAMTLDQQAAYKNQELDWQGRPIAGFAPLDDSVAITQPNAEDEIVQPDRPLDDIEQQPSFSGGGNSPPSQVAEAPADAPAMEFDSQVVELIPPTLTELEDVSFLNPNLAYNPLDANNRVSERFDEAAREAQAAQAQASDTDGQSTSAGDGAGSSGTDIGAAVGVGLGIAAGAGSGSGSGSGSGGGDGMFSGLAERTPIELFDYTQLSPTARALLIPSIDQFTGRRI